MRLSQPSSPPRWSAWALTVAWLLLLALLPWWLGLPLLLALAAALLSQVGRLADYTGLLRRALHWGVPGWLLSLLLALGGDARAWVLTMCAALVGFSLLVLLDNWLGRDQPRQPSPMSSAEWSELAMASIGPAAVIIELQPPIWLDVADGVSDPRGGTLHAAGRRLTLADGRHVDGVDARCSFSADGRWLAMSLMDGRGTVLRDRQRDKLHRLRGWQLCGWHANQPWLSHGEDGAPLGLAHVLGHDDPEPA